MAEAPRTFWQFLKANWHTFELQLSEENVEFRELKGEGNPPITETVTLEAFLDGDLQMKISTFMTPEFLNEALASAKWLKEKKKLKSETARFKNAYLTELLAGSQAFFPRFEKELSGLSEVQLNWKPSPDRWSVGECLDHLIISNRNYFPILAAVAKGNQHQSFWAKLPILHNFWGKMIYKAVAEKGEKKSKSPAVFQPTRSKVDVGILAEFLKSHSEMIRLIRETDQVDHDETIITSPAASFITFPLKYACLILVTHEKRHFHQALAVTKMPEFPSDTEPIS